tara:strand:- start:46 stop:453 length:408 start_codon:yes stop_codon:yes gene_type:complete
MSPKKSISKNTENYLSIFLILILLALIFYTIFFVINKNSIEAFNTEKLILEIYTAPWCGHCKRFEEGDKIAKIKQKLGSDKVVHHIDGSEECAKNMKKYNLGGYPSMIVTRGGNLVSTYSGPREIEPICNFYNSQ